MSDSGAPSTPPSSYFTGSDRVQDYFIDLEVDAERQPLDIQAYLECIAIEQRHQELPDDPKGDWNRVSPYGPYVPRLDLATQGLNALRQAAKTKEHGLWIDPSEVTADDMTSTTNYGRNPWLAYLVRTSRLAQAASEAALYPHGPRSPKAVVYGNVRVPYPSGLRGPATSWWLAGAANVYGQGHPVTLLAPDPSADIIPDLRWNLCSEGVEHENFPVLAFDPFLQQLFDTDPKAYDQLIADEWQRGAPRAPFAVGYEAWSEREAKERRERNDAYLARAEEKWARWAAEAGKEGA